MTSTSSVEFNGQVVVISGAATGIGKASAQLIAARGATVIALDFNAAALSDLAKELNKKAAPLKINETDMVRAEVRGVISSKEDSKILWENKLEIVEIISITSVKETENIIKLGTE